MRRVLAVALLCLVSACTSVQSEDSDAGPTDEPDAVTPAPDAGTETPEPDAGEPDDQVEDPPPAKGVLALADAQHDFGTVTLGQGGAPFATSLKNTGDGAVPALTYELTGPGKGDFTVSAPCRGGTLEAAAGCAVTLGFLPLQEGVRTATLTFSGDGVAPVAMTLSGTGVDNGQLAVAPGGVDFGTVAIGTTSLVRTFTITNRRLSALPTPTITLDDKTFASTSTCTGELAPKATCTVSVTFRPEVGGPEGGLLTVASGAEKAIATLTGTGSGRLEVKKVGTGTGTITGAGVDCGTRCSSTVRERAATLRAIRDTGSHVTKWSVPTCKGSICDVPITAGAQAVTATFTKDAVLSVLIERKDLTNTSQVTLAGHTPCTFAPANARQRRCNYQIESGLSVTVKAVPGPCAKFTKWTGACAGAPASCDLTMTQNRNTEVVFEEIPNCRK